jgi:G6PDH family F420-dependent oxidoreductase
VLGAIAQVTSTMSWQTAVTCPTLRIHPAVLAQATATTATLMPGRFRFGVGTGEALNEHIFGDAWPRPEVRLEMLEEAVALIRQLWTGELTSWNGKHYTVDRAQIYTLPEAPPPIIVSAFHEQALALAAKIGDGFATTKPDGDSRKSYIEQGGKGPTQAAMKCCYGPDADAAADLAHKLWANESLTGTLAQTLSTPAEFEAASELVTKEMVAGSLPCGPDPDVHIKALQAYVDAGFDEIFVGQIGPDQAAAFEFYQREVLPNVT